MTQQPTLRLLKAPNGILQAQHDRLIGRVFNNRFRIESLIARGGMGRVYRAIQEPLGRVVALKVLNPDYSAESSKDFHRRFFLEAATAAVLSHPHTVTIFDYGCTDDQIYYIAMEYLEGLSLRMAMARYRLFDAHRALAIVRQIILAVREAHAHGVIHRDLKPANIFLIPSDDTADFVKVLDFGLVKHMHALAGNVAQLDLTRSGIFLGSPGYMSPEQICSQPLDRRCDVYAIGVLLYEMLTGCPPFVRTSPIEVMRAHVYEEPPRFASANPAVQLPAELEHMVRVCLAKNPHDRFPHMDALLLSLTQVMRLLPAAKSNVIHLPLAFAYTDPTASVFAKEEGGWSVVSSTGILGALYDLPTKAMISPTVANQDVLSDVLTPTVIAPMVMFDHKKSTWQRLLCGIKIIVALVLLCSLHASISSPIAPAALSRLHINSIPSGAAVWLEDYLLCEQTPCDVALPHGMVGLRFSLAEYHDFFVYRLINRAHMHIDKVLYPSNAPIIATGR